jgi:hypothetical protein
MSDEDEIAVAMLRLMPPHDISGARAQRLRQRSHREMRGRTAPRPEHPGALVWRRLVGPALIGAWSAIYLIETFRAAAALYRF